MTALTNDVAPAPAAGTPEANAGNPAAIAPAQSIVPPVANQKVEDTAGDKAKVGAQPVEYTDFTLPEGMTLDTEISGKFKEWAKAKNLTQEEAQGLVDFQTALANKQMDAWGQKLLEWKAAAESDSEFGGAAFPANVAVAKQALDKFGSPELKDILNTSGMGDNPHVIRFMYRVGKAIGTDNIMGSGNGLNGGPKDPAKTMYPNMA